MGTYRKTSTPERFFQPLSRYYHLLPISSSPEVKYYPLEILTANQQRKVHSRSSGLESTFYKLYTRPKHSLPSYLLRRTTHLPSPRRFIKIFILFFSHNYILYSYILVVELYSQHQSTWPNHCQQIEYPRLYLLIVSSTSRITL